MYRLPAEALSFRLRPLYGAKDAQEAQAQGIAPIWPKAELGISALMRQPVVCLSCCQQGAHFQVESSPFHKWSPDFAPLAILTHSSAGRSRLPSPASEARSWHLKDVRTAWQGPRSYRSPSMLSVY